MSSYTSGNQHLQSAPVFADYLVKKIEKPAKQDRDLTKENSLRATIGPPSGQTLAKEWPLGVCLSMVDP